MLSFKQRALIRTQWEFGRDLLPIGLGVLCMCVRACVHVLIIVLKWHPNFRRSFVELLYMCPSPVGWVIHFSPAIGRYLSVPGDGTMRGNASIHDTSTAFVLMVNEISNRGRMSRDQWKVRLACLLHELSPWKTNRFAASQEIPRILWNPKVHYRIQKWSPPLLSWASSIQSIPPHPTSWRSILLLSSHLGLESPKWSLNFRFSHENPVTPFLSPYGLHALPIPFFSILSPGQYLVRSRDH